MRMKPLLILFIAFILIAAFFYWQANYARIDKTAALRDAIAPVFLKFGLTDDRLAKKSVEENRLNNRRYISSYAEYNVPRSFNWEPFDSTIRRALKKKAFKVHDVEISFERRIESRTFIICYGKFDILTLKINRKGKAIVPKVFKLYKNPMVAIVVDDFGYSKNNLETFLSLKQPITLSILPGQRYSKEIAELARKRGFETILHLPLEAENEDAHEEMDTIKTTMSEREITLRLDKEISSVPDIDGVSNHQGSKATADTAAMTAIIKHLKSKGLYYFDSLTSERSVCGDVAASLGVGFAKRDIFLDNSNNTMAIERQLLELKAMAFKHGSAIAIGHDRRNTAEILSTMLPEMAKEGIKFVRLSTLVKR